MSEEADQKRTTASSETCSAPPICLPVVLQPSSHTFLSTQTNASAAMGNYIFSTLAAPEADSTTFASASALHFQEVLNTNEFPSVRALCALPIAQQAQYADPICKANVDKDWLKEQVRAIGTNSDLSAMRDQFNQTSIGNIAYIALYAKSETTRGFAQAGLAHTIAMYE